MKTSIEHEESKNEELHDITEFYNSSEPDGLAKLTEILKSIAAAGCTCAKIRQYENHTGCLYFHTANDYYSSFLDYYHPLHEDIIMHSPELVVFSKSLPHRCSKPRRAGDYVIKETDYIYDHLLLEYGQFKITTDQNTTMKLLRRSNRHRLFMCPIMKMGENCLFHCETRLQAGVRFICPHVSKRAQNDPFQPLLQHYLKQERRFQTTETETGVPLSGIKQETTEALLKLFTNTTMKFTDIDQQDFKSFCRKLIEIGQRNPTEDIANILPEMERHTLPDMLCQKGLHTLRALYQQLSGSAVSLQFDGATINHKKLILVTLTPLELNGKAHFFQIGSSPTTQADYELFLSNIFDCLHQQSITVGNICTDGYPVQRLGIFSFIEKLSTSLNLIHFTITIHPTVIWCHNHLTNLVTAATVKNTVTENSTVKTAKRISIFARKAQSHHYKTRLGGICPSVIPSRWLSIWLVESFIRLHRHLIIENHYLKPIHLKSILKYEVLLTPLMELQLLFENERTKLIHVFPALLRAIQQYLLIAAQPFFSRGRWLKATVYLVHQLFKRFFFPTSHGVPEVDKALVAFALTPLGQSLYKVGAFVSGFSIDKSLENVHSLLFVNSIYFFFKCYSLCDITGSNGEALQFLSRSFLPLQYITPKVFGIPEPVLPINMQSSHNRPVSLFEPMLIRIHGIPHLRTCDSFGIPDQRYSSFLSHLYSKSFSTISSSSTKSPSTTISSSSTKSPSTTISSSSTKSPSTTISSSSTKSPSTTISSSSTKSPSTTISSSTPIPSSTSTIFSTQSNVSSFTSSAARHDSHVYLPPIYYMTPQKTAHLHPLIAGTTQTLSTLLEPEREVASQTVLSDHSFLQHITPAHICSTPETTLMCIESLLGLLSSYYSNEEFIRKKPILKDGWNNLQCLLNEKERVLINKTLPTDIYHQIIEKKSLSSSADSSTSPSSDSSVPIISTPNLDTRKRLRTVSRVDGKNPQDSKKCTTHSESSLSSSIVSSSYDSLENSSEELSEFQEDDGDKIMIDEDLIEQETGASSQERNSTDPRTFSFEVDHSDAELHQHLSNIVLYITQTSPAIIIPAYKHILQSVLPRRLHFWIDSLETILKSRLSLPFGSCISSFVSDMITLSNGSTIEKLYHQLTTMLCSSVISESSCERGLGKAKSISTKTRSNMRTEVLNAILLAS